MATNGYFSHTGLNGSTPTQRCQALGFALQVSENIAYGWNLNDMHNALMDSPGHYANTIDDSNVECGVGIA